VQAIKKYLYLKETTMHKFLYDIKEASRESVPAHATVAKCHTDF